MAVLYPFSNRTVELLRNAPEAGETHRWLAQVASRLGSVLNAEDSYKFLRKCCDQLVFHRNVPDSEIANAVEFAYDSPPVAVTDCGRKSHDWPKPNPDLINEVLSGVEPLFDAAKSTGYCAEFVMRHLFRMTELVCTGRVAELAAVRLLDNAVYDAHWLQFIVPNPMRHNQSLNNRGKLSGRCQNNVKKRRYLVAEFDDSQLTKDHQARLITKLSTLAPLAMVVDSGGKSLHGWFCVESLNAKDQVRFFSVACLLGADPSRWDIAGWVRMPGGYRIVDGKPSVKQLILFFNPEVLHEGPNTAADSAN